MSEEEETSSAELSDSLEENIPEGANEELTQSDINLEEAASASIGSNVEEAEAAVAKAQEPILEGLQETAGTKGPITNDLAIKASKENPTDPDAKALREKVIKPGLDSCEESVKNEQEKNGEGGKNLKDSPKTQASLLKKYGPAALKLLLACALVGFGIYELDKIAEEMSGCYRFSTNTAGSQVKVGCSESTCSCQNIAQCGPNNTPCTQANGIQYMWRKFTALDALCQIPKMVMDPIASGLEDLLKPLKEIVVGILIVAVILFILYVIYKMINKKTSPQINVD